MEYVETENKGIVRDVHSHALINTDRNAYSLYKAKRESDNKADAA